MKIEEKAKLLELLSLYQADLLNETAKIKSKVKSNTYGIDTIRGLRIRYNHARTLIKHLGVEIAGEWMRED
jgi:hypothetical protein